MLAIATLIIGLMWDFFHRSETVATSLNWAILLLATHPAEQENLFHELDEDKSHGQMGSRMEAFLLETLR